MKKLTLFLCFMFLCGNVLFATDHLKKSNNRVVMISLDGISVAGFKKARTPNLDLLLAEGALSTTTRVVMPSVTLPNWTSIFTGSGPEQHGVVDNTWEINKFVLPSIMSDNEGYYPSVFTVLKENVPTVKTAFYYNWINLFYPHNRRNFDEVSYLEDDAYVENYEKAFDFIVKYKNDPILVFLYSVHTDHAGHKYGWDSAEYIKSIEEADDEIGVFLNKVKSEGLYDSTTFLFLSDHGGINKGHGGVTVDEMVVPWGIVGPNVKKGYKIEQPNNTVNTASTILHLFGIKQPQGWVGQVNDFVFK